MHRLSNDLGVGCARGLVRVSSHCHDRLDGEGELQGRVLGHHGTLERDLLLG